MMVLVKHVPHLLKFQMIKSNASHRTAVKGRNYKMMESVVIVKNILEHRETVKLVDQIHVSLDKSC